MHVSHTQSSCRKFLKNPAPPFVIDGEQPAADPSTKNPEANIQKKIKI